MIPASVSEHKLFSTAISNDKKLEKEIKIQQESVQLTGQKLRAHREESQFQLLRAHVKVNKTIYKSHHKVTINSRSTGEFVNDFTVKFPLISTVKSLRFGNFMLTATVDYMLV